MDGRVLSLPDPMVERIGILAKAALDQCGVAQPDRDEDVEPRSAVDQQPRNFRRLPYEVLRRRRFMIHVARIDVGARVDQVLRDLERARAVQRRLPVASACSQLRRVGFDEFPHAVEHAEVRGREDVDDRAALDERRRFGRRDVVLENPERAGPPVALQIEVGPVLQQDVDERQVLARHPHRPSAERAERRVDGGPHVGVILEQTADTLGIAVAQRAAELFERRSGQRVDLAAHLRPAGEPVAAGHDQLRVRESERGGRRRRRV